MKKKVVYWAPIISNIATKKAVINSAFSLTKFSRNYKVTLLNVCGEFSDLKISKQNINIFNLDQKIIELKLSGVGYLKSRLFHIFIFLKSFFPLIKFLKKEAPDYIIIHMLTSLPLLIFLFLNIKTKCILRISGLPKLNFLRRSLWKISSKKIYKVTCPTELTKKKLENLNIFKSSQLTTLYDPIFTNKDLKKRHKHTNYKEKFLLSAGRLTRQKNFTLLIEAFDKFKLIDTNLYIAGEGEEKNKLLNLINKKNLSDKIKLIGYRSDLIELMNKCECFILTSKWEDPGFVLIEAAIARATIISSDSENGPKEILNNEKNGFLFKNDSLSDLIDTFNRYKITSSQSLYQKKIDGLKNAKNFSIISHYKKLNAILKSN